MPKTAQFIEETKTQAESSAPKSAEKKNKAGNRRGMTGGSRMALRPIKPGEIRNPKGTNGYKDLAKQIMRAIFENNEEAIYKAIGKQILKGNAYCLDVAAKRAYGNIPNKIEMGGPEGGPIEASIKVTFVNPRGN